MLGSIAINAGPVHVCSCAFFFGSNYTLHVLVPGSADAKSYVIISQLPANVYRKYVENVNTAHLTGFTFVIVSIVYLAGGKITEGMLSNWFRHFCFSLIGQQDHTVLSNWAVLQSCSFEWYFYVT